MTARYRSKETVEAFCWTPPCPIPGWLHRAGFRVSKRPNFRGSVAGRAVRPGDFIVRDSLAVYRPEVFDSLYERIEE